GAALGHGLRPPVRQRGVRGRRGRLPRRALPERHRLTPGAGFLPAAHLFGRGGEAQAGRAEATAEREATPSCAAAPERGSREAATGFALRVLTRTRVRSRMANICSSSSSGSCWERL